MNKFKVADVYNDFMIKKNMLVNRQYIQSILKLEFKNSIQYFF